MKLLVNALAKFIIGLFLVGALLFLPAGTLFYPSGWLFVALLFIPVAVTGVVLYIKAPSLLASRLNEKEKQKTQKGVVGASGIMFIVGFIIPSLDFRFTWSSVPTWLITTASVLFLVGYALFAEVLRENEYLSRTVEVQKDQRVISTGLYGIVRHPMYLATLFMFLPIPLILGSFWGLIPFAIYPIVIAIRICDEEKLLRAELAGYEEYTKKVNYKLIPFIW